MAAHQRGAEVLFLILPNENDLNDTPDTVRGWEIYRKVMRDTAKRYGAPVLDLPKIYQESGLKSTDLFIDKMHPSIKGHQILAKSLYKEMLPWSKGEKLEKHGRKRLGRKERTKRSRLAAHVSLEYVEWMVRGRQTDPAAG